MRHWRTGFDPIVETSTEDTRDNADDKSFGEVEFLDALFLFFFRQLSFLHHPCPAADIDTQQTEHHTGQYDLCPVRSHQLMKGCFAGSRYKIIIDRWDQRAEG